MKGAVALGSDGLWPFNHKILTRSWYARTPCVLNASS